MFPNLSNFFLAVLCLANIVSADYWSFVLNQYRCIEPREWDADKVYFRMNLITTLSDGKTYQNVTKVREIGSMVPRSAVSGTNVYWQDITIGDGEANLLAASTMWNVGDEDPQKVALEVTQVVLKIIRGNFVVSAIATALSYVVKQFQGMYQCEGPVVLDAWSWTKEELQGMEYDVAYCVWRDYVYTTGGGCIDGEPLNLDSKNSKYQAQHCIVRRKGESTRSWQPPKDE